MKLFKSIIAASLLGLCVTAQSMDYIKSLDIVKTAQAHPYATAGLAGMALFNAYQLSSKVSDIREKRALASKHAQPLKEIYNLAKAINTNVNMRVVLGKNSEMLGTLRKLISTIAQDLPELAGKCSLFSVNAEAIIGDRQSQNPVTLNRYKTAYDSLMEELTPMVKFRLFEGIKNGSAQVAAFVGNTAQKYPKLTALTGLSGLATYQYKYNKGLADTLTQWTTQGIVNANLGIDRINQSISGDNKWLYGLGAAATISLPVFIALINKCLGGQEANA